MQYNDVKFYISLLTKMLKENVAPWTMRHIRSMYAILEKIQSSIYEMNNRDLQFLKKI